MRTTEISQPTAECPHPELWSMHDDNSAEVEVGQFISQLIETIKPNLVVETGTHLGVTAMKIGVALELAHLPGKLITCDPYLDEGKNLPKILGNVDYQKCSSLDLQITETIDLLFCDSDPRIRMKEVERFWPNLTPNSIILIHDVNTGCHNELRQELLGWKDRLSIVFLPTPRGLAICQKL